MRLLNIRSEGNDRCVLQAGEVVVDVQRALRHLGVDGDSSIRAFLSREDWRELGARIRELDDREELTQPLAGLDVGPIVPDPQKIIFVGGNTHSHLAEAAPYTNATAPLRPMLTAKTPNAINGPYDPIVQPTGTSSMDYEAELCVVIGKRARRVAEEDVADVVAGYTVANDVSDREYQLSSWEDNSFYRTHYLGKSFDGFCPCGPALVTADEIPDLDALRVTCTVNGEVKQNDLLSDLYFSVEKIVSYLSQGVTLTPGDLILMGSPAGVAHFLKPPPYVGPGDVVRCEVESIGHIENTIVAEIPAGA